MDSIFYDLETGEIYQNAQSSCFRQMNRRGHKGLIETNGELFAWCNMSEQEAENKLLEIKRGK